MATRPDIAAKGALAADVRRPVTFCYLDVAGEPIRVTDAPYSLTFAGTGDVDLDGFTFEAVDPRMVSVGVVKNKESGADTLTLELSGLAGVDDETMTLFGDRTKWVGRDARLWKAMLHPVDLNQIGGMWCYYTGYMSVPRVVGDASSQVIQLDIETYLAFFGRASNRTYLDQQRYDPGDLSAQLAIATANGAGKPG